MTCNFTTHESEDHKKITFSMTCPRCGKTNTLTLPNNALTARGLKRLRDGALAQNAFPLLNADQREFFITGNCSCIWGS